MLAKKFMDRVQLEKNGKHYYRDSDGFWIMLKTGWMWEPQAHLIREDTLKEAEAQVRRSEPCDCEQCDREPSPH